jgi:hypothetical protein
MKNDGVAEMKNEECILPPTGWHYSSFFILNSSFPRLLRAVIRCGFGLY